MLRNYIRGCSTIGRNTNIFRGNTVVRDNKAVIVDLVLRKTREFENSELMRKVRVAKAFYTLEMSPPSFHEGEELKEDIELARDFIRQGCWKYLTVKQAWILFLVCLEVFMWFYVGEVIGKMHIVGYKV